MESERLGHKGCGEEQIMQPQGSGYVHHLVPRALLTPFLAKPDQIRGQIGRGKAEIPGVGSLRYSSVARLALSGTLEAAPA